MRKRFFNFCKLPPPHFQKEATASPLWCYFAHFLVFLSQVLATHETKILSAPMPFRSLIAPLSVEPVVTRSSMTITVLPLIRFATDFLSFRVRLIFFCLAVLSNLFCSLPPTRENRPKHSPSKSLATSRDNLSP